MIDELNKNIKHRLNNTDGGKQNYKKECCPGIMCITDLTQTGLEMRHRQFPAHQLQTLYGHVPFNSESFYLLCHELNLIMSIEIVHG